MGSRELSRSDGGSFTMVLTAAAYVSVGPARNGSSEPPPRPAPSAAAAGSDELSPPPLGGAAVSAPAGWDAVSFGDPQSNSATEAQRSGRVSHSSRRPERYEPGGHAASSQTIHKARTWRRHQPWEADTLIASDTDINDAAKT